MIQHCTRLAFACWLLAGTAATAQVGPEIAYATGRAEIHLVNADSTGQRLLYRGGARTEISHVDIKPGGGQLAIEEHIKSKSPRAGETNSTIKIIDYDANGSVVGSIRTLPLACRTGSLDYHPTDGTLLYRSCSDPKRIYRLNTATMNSVDLGLDHDAFIASWLDATHLLYYTNISNPPDPDDRKFWTVSTADLTTPTQVLAHPAPGSLDTSTSGDHGLWSGFEEIQLIDIGLGQISLFQAGNKGHFSPDDVYVAYITGDGRFILIRRFDGSGASTNLVGRGSFTALDWRN